MSKGKLIVISGPSGVGKGTALGIAMEQKPELTFSVSATTRQPRPGEVEGKSYYFVTPERFREMIARDEFLEYDEHNKTFYGTPRAQVEQKRQHGPVLLDIDPMGAKKVKEKVPDVVLIFIMPPSVEELERRLRGRGTEDEASVERRLNEALNELAIKDTYDQQLVNRDVDTCAEELYQMMHKLAE